MLNEDEILAIVRSYVRRTLEGEGAIRGVPCEIDNIEETNDSIKVLFRWQEKDGVIHHQEMDIPKPVDKYEYYEQYIGKWVNHEDRYRRVIEINEPNLIQKGVLFKVCDLPEGYRMLTRGYGIIKTYENSYSNNDILVYANRDGIYAKQTFTGYPEKIYIIIEYIKENN